MAETKNLLEVKNLTVDFTTDQGTVYAVRDVSFDLAPGEILGIVGESGSGKSVTMYAIMGLLADNGRVVQGQVSFDGQDIGRGAFASEREYNRAMRQIRGNTLAMIFQDPMTFLNPVLTIEKQLVEPILNHTSLSRAQARERALELMRQVGIPSPEKRITQYPHEFSGGMRQRIIIAIALSNNPKLIIADEPTTALDVTIQAQILELMKDLQRKENTSIIFITHNLGVVAEICDRVSVMYAGRIVEQGKVNDIFYHPEHPYTRRLLQSIPRLDEEDDERLVPIEGTPIDLLNPPQGCNFGPRCTECMKICLRQKPPFAQVGEDHISACWLHFMDALKKEGEDK